MRNIIDHRRNFVHNQRGLSNLIVVALGLVILVVIVSNVIFWSYQMNQLDWEKMREDMKLINVGRATNSSWFVTQSEYTVNKGNRVNGNYTGTQAIDSSYERFNEAAAVAPSYYPSGYQSPGSTTYISGSPTDLQSNNGVYMTFRSYSSATSGQTLYAHQETTTIGGSSYYFQRLSTADAAGTTLSASAGTTGRKLMGRFVYQLTGVSSIPASIWTIYYRAYRDTGSVVAHGDADILVRMTNGTVRTTLATNVANSGSLTTSWSRLSGTYSWAAYTVVAQTDYLEIDYNIEVTRAQSGKFVYLRIDDNTLAAANQTRAANIYLPSEYTSEVEFTGSSNTGAWNQLVWSIDSAWTAGSVGVTLQLYNYTLGNYPTIGNGFVSYTSSATANTDETKNQTITQNPTQFRNATGYWKLKVKGIKTTTTSFDFKADWIEFKPNVPGNYQLDLNGTFTIDLSTYPLSYIQTIEVELRYKASDFGEKWYLKAYNWTALTYSDNCFNTTAGRTPTTGWDNYAVNITSKWQSYVNNNGIMYIKLLDNGPDSTSTTIDIDFLSVRTRINGANFTFRNQGSMTSHVVSLWVINSTNHRRYDSDIFVNSAETFSYIRADVSLPSGQYFIKVITERGNTAIYSAG